MRALRYWGLILVLGTLACLFWADPVESDNPDQQVISEGLLIYIPPPDVYICFCGSYFLESTDREKKSYYLVSPMFNLAPYIGKSIIVTGRPAMSPCSGTLFQYCDFLVLERIEENTITPGQDHSWGKIKALYK